MENSKLRIKMDKMKKRLGNNRELLSKIKELETHITILKKDKHNQSDMEDLKSTIENLRDELASYKKNPRPMLGGN